MLHEDHHTQELIVYHLEWRYWQENHHSAILFCEIGSELLTQSNAFDREAVGLQCEIFSLEFFLLPEKIPGMVRGQQQDAHQLMLHTIEKCTNL